MDWLAGEGVQTVEEMDLMLGVAMYWEVVMDWLEGKVVETLEKTEWVLVVAM
jgi:hypothetical protein